MKTSSKKKIAVMVLAAMMLTGCGKSTPDLVWPSSGLALMIPRVDGKGEVEMDYEDLFEVEVENQSADSYRSYIEQCKEKGFTREAQNRGDSYEAYNDEGYNIYIVYWDSQKSMSIRLSAPEQLGTLNWPTAGMVSMLPVPDADQGKVDHDGSDYFRALVSMDADQYQAYTTECMKAGFDVDYSKEDTYFRAYDQEGYKLSVEKTGMGVYCITLHAPEEEEPEDDPGIDQEEPEDAGDSTEKTPDPSSEQSETSKPVEKTESEQPEAPEEEESAIVVAEQKPNDSSSSSSISPGSSSSSGSSDSDKPSASFREVMDSYEQFMNEYVSFMKRWENADESDTMAMLADYSDYMSRYAEFMDKVGSMDEDDMSPGDYLYYIEVTTRVNKKLAEIAQ